ncbi:MAG: sulfotransferase family 2 domain-containing protein [Candidatus Methylacidiphilales bacterium]|nr:sulfotransferase family 2 domain-containing protein [Candidatus Methylacidiphilales bacterium]
MNRMIKFYPSRLAVYGKNMLREALNCAKNGREGRIYNNKRILHDYKCIFIHIPKTAGTSVSRALFELPKTIDTEYPRSIRKLRFKHLKATAVKSYLGDETWNRHFSFAFVRNPWDLMVSSYNWWVQKASHDPTFKDRIGSSEWLSNFESFIFSPFGRFKLNELEGNMLDWVTENGDIIVDYVGKVETFNSDWAAICHKINAPFRPMPCLNSTIRLDYRQYYNSRTRAAIAERFHREIELFEYKY